MAADVEAVAEQVFVALADPTRRAILAALATDGPSTVTDLAGRLPITRQAIAKHLTLLTGAGLVVPEPGERRRIRFRLQTAPVRIAQQFVQQRKCCDRHERPPRTGRGARVNTVYSLSASRSRDQLRWSLFFSGWRQVDRVVEAVERACPCWKGKVRDPVDHQENKLRQA